MPLSQEFREFFVTYFAAAGVDVSSVDWNTWFHGLGALPVTVPLDNTLRAAANELAALWYFVPLCYLASHYPRLTSVPFRKADGIPASFPVEFASFTVGQKISFFDELLGAQVCVTLG